MANVKVKELHLSDRVGFGKTNQEMGKLTESEAMEYLKVGYDGKDASIINKFVEPPSAKEVNDYFDKKVLAKTAPAQNPKDK